MAVTQSRTQVNDKASGAEPMQKLNPSAVVPGQSITDIGGPTNTDYRPDNNSAKIDNEGTSQSNTEVNDKASGADPSKRYVTAGDALEGGESSGSYNGVKGEGRGKGNEPMPKPVSYTHLTLPTILLV